MTTGLKDKQNILITDQSTKHHITAQFERMQAVKNLYEQIFTELGKRLKIYINSHNINLKWNDLCYYITYLS
jgi:hypothetical protein